MSESMVLPAFPPLALLPAFAAAGRLGSFKLAASELHVTPSAVSQQIRALERALGTTLFVRRGRSVALTAAGARYLEEVQRALGDLALASRELARPREAHRLRISMAPLVAHEFLLPRLCELHARFPALEFSIDATMRVVDVAAGEADAAIRVGPGSWAGLTAYLIGSVETTPVCSPARAREIHHASDLCMQALITVDGQDAAYAPLRALWSGAAPRTLTVNDCCLEALRAAEHGLGVTLGIFPIVTDWVTQGRLAVPLPLRGALPGGAFLVHRSRDPRADLFAAIAHWLKRHYSALPRLKPGRLGAGIRAVSLP